MAFWNTNQVITINDGAVPNDGTGDNIRAAFEKVNNNFSNISVFLSNVDQDALNLNVVNQVNSEYARINNSFLANITGTNANITANVTGNVIVANLTVYSKANTITTGNTYSGNLNVGNILTVGGNVQIVGNTSVGGTIIPTANLAYDLGSPNFFFRNLYTQGLVQITTVQASSDAGLLVLHSNLVPGDTKDVGIFGKYYKNSANGYGFFGQQYSTLNFVYKITPTDVTAGNSVVYDGVYGNTQFGSQLLSNTTAATSTSTGALIVAGGAGIAGNVYGSWFHGAANLTVANIGRVTGNLNVTGNVSVGGYQVLTTNLPGVTTYPGSTIAAGNLTVTSVTPSTSTSTGALILTNGGAGISGNVYSGGGFYGSLTGTILTAAQPNITSVGTLTSLQVQTSIGTPAITISGSGVTGAPLIVSSGGANISGAMNVNGTGTITAAGNVTTPWLVGNAAGTIANYSGNVSVNNFFAPGTANIGTLIVSSISVGGAGISGGNVTGNIGNLTALSVSTTLKAAEANVVTINGTTIGNVGSTHTGNVARMDYVSGTSAGGNINLIGNFVLGANSTLYGNSIGSTATYSGNVNADKFNGAHYGSIIGATGDFTGNITASNVNAKLYGDLVSPAASVGTLTASGNTASTSTVYARGIYDNSNRVASTSGGAGNISIYSNGFALLTPTGQGATTVGSASSIPVVTTDVYGRVSALTAVSVATTLNVTANTTSNANTGWTYTNVPLLTSNLFIAGGVDTTTTANNAQVVINSTSTLATVTGRGATTASQLGLTGNLNLGAHIVPIANANVAGSILYSLGNTSTYWNGVYALSGVFNNITVGGQVSTFAGPVNHNSTNFFTNLNTANAVISGGYISSLTNATVTTGTVTTLTATTLTATNVYSANVYIDGGYIDDLTNIAVATGWVRNLNSTVGNISGLTATNFYTANARINGGYVNNLTNIAVATGYVASLNSTTGNVSTLTATTLTATNFYTANARVNGGYVDNLTNIAVATGWVRNLNSTVGNISGLTVTDFYTANARVNGGYIDNLTNIAVATGYVASLNSTTGNVSTLTATTLTGTNVYSANVYLNGGYIDNLTNAAIATGWVRNLNSTVGNISGLTVTDFYTANARINGGYVDNLTNIAVATGWIRAINSNSANISGPLFSSSLNTANAVISGGYVSSLTNATVTTGTITTLTATTLTATNVYSANVYLNGGYINNLTNAAIATGWVRNLNSTVGNISGLTAGNFYSGNVYLNGGYANNIANISAGTAYIASLNSTTGNIGGLTATNFYTANARVNGGYVDNLTNIAVATGWVRSLNSNGANVSGVLFASSFNSGNVVISGGYISAISNISSAGTISAGGNVITTSHSTGDLVATGGLGVGGNVYVRGSAGNAIIADGTVYIKNTLSVSNIRSTASGITLIDDSSGSRIVRPNGSLYISGGSGSQPAATTGPAGIVIGNTNYLSLYGGTGDITLEAAFGGKIAVQNTTTSTSTSTGALVVSGGTGIAGNTFIGGRTTSAGNIIAASSTTSTSTTTGSFVAVGGAGIAGNVYTGGNIDAGGTARIRSTVASSSKTTGALIVDGGLGMAGYLYNGAGAMIGADVGGDLVTVGTGATSIVINAGASDPHIRSADDLGLRAAAGKAIITNAPINIGSSTGTALVHTGNIVPSANLTYNIGSNSTWYNNIYGVAIQAQYADLAEKYLPDADYEVGTVVAIGGSAEVTASTYGDRAIGVISEYPAYRMNAMLEGGTYVALKGRVPVKVTGAVRKGQRLVAYNNGTAVAAVPHANDVFAIALESSDDTGIKLIEAVIL